MSTEPCLCGAEDCKNCHPSQRSRKLAQALGPEEHVANCGSLCPVCKSWHIDGRRIDLVDGKAMQAMSCEDCEATWTDVYRLEGYIDLDVTH